MKIAEYINSNDTILNKKNIFTLNIYVFSMLDYFISKFKSKCVILHNSEKYLHENNIVSDFKQLRNCAILINNLDVDFPPPKKPYEYDVYFDKSKLPENYLDIPYMKKIHTDILPVLENNNIHVFAHAVSINHPNITMIPGGVFSKFDHFHLKTNAKTITCYANFGLHCDRWFGNPRQEILKALLSMKFVTSELIESTDKLRRDHLNYDYFYNQISKSKFAICPRGCSIDSYRIYDCICLGCIPIIEKYGGYEQFEDLPILFIDSYKDYAKLDESFLNYAYEKIMSRSDFNYAKLTTQYWVDKITIRFEKL